MFEYGQYLFAIGGDVAWRDGYCAVFALRSVPFGNKIGGEHANGSLVCVIQNLLVERVAREVFF